MCIKCALLPLHLTKNLNKREAKFMGYVVWRGVVHCSIFKFKKILQIELSFKEDKCDFPQCKDGVRCNKQKVDF
jgi:hypothetical protein